MGSMFAGYDLIVLIAQQTIKGSMCVVYYISTKIKKIIMLSLSSKRSLLHIEMEFYHIFFWNFSLNSK